MLLPLLGLGRFTRVGGAVVLVSDFVDLTLVVCVLEMSDLFLEARR